MLFEAVAMLLLIFLIFLMYMMVAPNSSASQKWAISGVVGNGSGGVYTNMFIGNDGTVYTVNGTSVNAISPEGQLQWSMPIPNLLNNSLVNGTNIIWQGVNAVTDNGTLYIDLTPVNPPQYDQPQGAYPGDELLVISPQGKLIYSKTTGVEDFYAKNGYLYVLDGNIYVFDSLGDEKWSAINVRSFVVSDSGTAFLLRTTNGYVVNGSEVNGFELDVCTQDGHYLSQINTSDYGMGEAAYDSSLLYSNHMVYLLLQGGIIAFNENGTMKWEYTYNTSPQSWSVLEFKYSGFSSSPFDNNGDLYLQQGPRVFYLSPDGVETMVTDNYNTSLSPALMDGEDGLIYTYQMISANNSYYNYGMMVLDGSIDDMISGEIQDGYWPGNDVLSDVSQDMGNRTLDQLNSVQISAIYIANSQEAWNYTLPLYKHTTTLTRSNYMYLIPYSDGIAKENTGTPTEWYQSNNITFGKKILVGTSYLDMANYNSTLYVNFWSLNYEYPAFFSQSECMYAGGIYAIGKNGTLLWYAPTDSMVSSMQENNGTIYYSTLNGKLYGNSTSAVAGLVLTAAAYIFLRFFLAGAVVRARKRIDSNKNRNIVQKFINENPGVSLYEISKSLNINMGTVRYHLMILGINHRVTSYKADDKYVRYFTNSGSYSMKQQLVLSLMRRDGINKVLNILIETPGSTNLEMATGLGMNESSTIRYLKELLANGIITKEKTPDGKQIYAINDVYKDEILFAITLFPKTSTLFRVQRHSPQ
jgi:predicted transcriptional regulator